MKQSEINHLRRLLGYVRCEIGQDPDEMVAMVQDFAAKGLRMDTDYAQRAMVEAHDQARRVPRYIREAVKALSKLVGPGEDVGDAEPTLRKIEAPTP